MSCGTSFTECMRKRTINCFLVHGCPQSAYISDGSVFNDSAVWFCAASSLILKAKAIGFYLAMQQNCSHASDSKCMQCLVSVRDLCANLCADLCADLCATCAPFVRDLVRELCAEQMSRSASEQKRNEPRVR